MPAELKSRMTVKGLAELNKRIAELLHDADNLRPVWDQAAEYMVRSTQNRINQTHKGPDGTPWARLADLTVKLKGNDWPLYATGKLVNGIQVGQVNRAGFTIQSTATNEDGQNYSNWVQKGVRRSKGKYKKKTQPHSPARPFMGFSKENVARICKMIRDHLKRT
jgi:phage gpG-like protein